MLLKCIYVKLKILSVKIIFRKHPPNKFQNKKKEVIINSANKKKAHIPDTLISNNTNKK